MKILNGVEISANGTIKAPCEMFTIRQDLNSSLYKFQQTSVNVVLITISTFMFCTYKYFRNNLQWEIATHKTELFRHNWFANQTEVEQRLDIIFENRHRDSSSNPANIWPRKDNRRSKDEIIELIRRKKLGQEDNNIDKLGLLPRDKLAVFSNIIAIRIELYILLVAIIGIWLFSMGFVISVRLSFVSSDAVSENRLTSVNHTQAILEMFTRTNEKIGQNALTYCTGDYQEMIHSLSTFALTAAVVFSSETELSHLVMLTLEYIFIYALLIEIAINCFYPTIKYPTIRQCHKRKIFMYGSSFKFMQLFFLGGIAISICLVFNQRLRE